MHTFISQSGRRGLTVALAVLGLSTAAHANLLTNGDFNTSTNGSTPDGWTSWSYGTQAFTSYNPGTSSYAKDATPFVNAGNYGEWWQNGGGWYQDVAATAGTTYAASVDSGTESWDNMEAFVHLLFKDASGTTLREDKVTVANFEPGKPWATYTISTNPAPAGTASVRFEMQSTGARGSVLFDNASLTATPEPASLGLLTIVGGTLLRRRATRV